MNHEPRPLKTMFALTSMPVGGAEILLADLVRSFDRDRIEPEICCLKERGPLGDTLAKEIPVHAQLIRHKLDFGVVGRLRKLLLSREIDALITVGAGDKMFWGRLAAHFARTPVVASALHSTGWPDGLGVMNRLLTPLTDAFIAVARTHGRFLVDREGLPADKVVVIPNGIDTARFQPNPAQRAVIREQLNLSRQAPVCTIVAALRPEKNHARFLRVAANVVKAQPETQFLIVGDGPTRETLATLPAELGIREHVHFLGCRSDIPELLAASDLFLLTSDNEANPVSVMEAMACGLPVVATRVGSIHEMVEDDVHGYLVSTDDEAGFAERVVQLVGDDATRRKMAAANRQKAVSSASLDVMVQGYQRLIENTYRRKQTQAAWPRVPSAQPHLPARTC